MEEKLSTLIKSEIKTVNKWMLGAALAFTVLGLGRLTPPKSVIPLKPVIYKVPTTPSSQESYVDPNRLEAINLDYKTGGLS